MSTLFETLDGMVESGYGDDITQTFSPQEIQEIDDKIVGHTKKKLGDAEYQKLETYLINNKDDENLKELVNQVVNHVGLTHLLGFMNLDEKSGCIKLGYKTTIMLYEKLEASNYDAEQAVMDF